MKQLTKILLLLIINCSLLINKGLTQNLVPNPSFETYSNCPFTSAQLSYTGNWVFCGASTDYYNVCSSSGNMSVPSNIYGYQDAFDGNAYIGMVAYAYGEPAPYSIREPAGTYLTQSLTIGEKYYLSFKVVLTINDFESGGACNKLGAKLSTVAYSNSNPTPVDNFAHVYTDSIITDTVNWTTIIGSFIADSAYSFISIGNFFDSTNSQYSHLQGPFPDNASAYYYIDDIRCSTDSNFVLSVNQKNNMIPSLFSIYPNPTSDVVNLIFEDNKVHTVTIYNSIGEAVLTQSVYQQSSINISTLSKGIYYVQTSIGRNITSKKLIIY